MIWIVLLASALRLIGLGTFPASLYWEEPALGYDAYSIWKTGKDYHGNPWPMVAFTSFGDYKPSGYFYLAAPFVGILGLNNWSIRLPSALAGIVTVYLVYLIGQELFKDKMAAQLAALSLAIIPWHIHFSRTAFEANVATMWLCAGVWLMLKARRATSYLMYAAICFVLACYTYHGLRLLAPLIAGLCLITINKWWKIKWTYISIIVSIVLMMPILINLRNPVVSQRFKETSFFNESKAVSWSNSMREKYGNTIISRTVFHRYWFWASEIVMNMTKHLSPEFLFIRGDGNPRHQVAGPGLLYPWMTIPLALALLKLNKNKQLLILVVWIILAMIPPALSLPSPHTLRFLPAAPAFALIIGYGLTKFKKIWTILILIAASGFFISYLMNYYGDYTTKYANDWQYGYKQALEYLSDEKKPGEKVFFTRKYGRPSIYVLYYLQYPPKLIQQDDIYLPKDQAELLSFDDWDFMPQNNQDYTWMVNDQHIIKDNYRLIKTISNPEEIPVFYIYKKTS